MEYEVYVPEDFPSDEWGIISPDVNYSASNKGGGGIPSADGASTYIGMGGTTELLTQKKNEYFCWKYIQVCKPFPYGKGLQGLQVHIQLLSRGNNF